MGQMSCSTERISSFIKRLLYCILCAQFDYSSFSRFRDIIGGRKIENGSRDPNYAPFKGDLSSVCWDLAYLCTKFDHSFSCFDSLLSEICRNGRYLKGWVTSRANFRYVGTSSAIRLWTDRYIGELWSYNFSTGSFHTKKVCSRLLSTEVEFYWQKQEKSHFVPPFGGLSGNVHGLSMARWKARGRLPISAN